MRRYLRKAEVRNIAKKLKSNILKNMCERESKRICVYETAHIIKGTTIHLGTKRCSEPYGKLDIWREVEIPFSLIPEDVEITLL